MAGEIQRASPERWRHGQERFCDGTRDRVAPGLASLRKSGEIGDAEAAAAERWYRDYAYGVLGARDPERTGCGASGDRDGSQVARVMAVASCRAVEDALGCETVQWLVVLLVDEMSFTTMATLFEAKRARADGISRVIGRQSRNLQVLASFYANVDRRRN